MAEQNELVKGGERIASRFFSKKKITKLFGTISGCN
jgi:hypothetical protein